MKNIDNLKIFPIETDTIVDWSPAREIFKILGDEIQGSIWNHIHLSRILRLVEWREHRGQSCPNNTLTLQLTDYPGSECILTLS